MLVLTASLLAFAPATGPRALVSRAAVRPLASPLPQLLPHKAEVRVPQIVMQEEAAATEEGSLKETLVTGGFFALWYLFNIGYNIYNKKALNAMAIPWTMALLQLVVGIPYVAALWATGLRKAPKLTTDNIKTLVPVSLGHLGTHIGAVISLGAGAVSFTHIIKASEPVVSAGLSAVMLGRRRIADHARDAAADRRRRGARLAQGALVHVARVLGGDPLERLVGAARDPREEDDEQGRRREHDGGQPVRRAHDPRDDLPPPRLRPHRDAGDDHGGDQRRARRRRHPRIQRHAARNSARNSAQLARRNSPTPHIPPRSQVSLLAGAFYYLYNEVAFLALGRVNPVTHAVGNTIKRVVIIIASVIAFKTPISTLGAVGSSIAIFGTLLYSLAKNKYG